ncbi:MAG: master DNA invertase Mpi family serine-type recombinase [Alphaproteobacteria bacterium]
MIYGYIRVSTDKQSVENQRFEIENFCKKENIKVDRWIKEKISSQKDINKRKLGKLIKNIKKNDILITSELSRLGRNLLQIMGILHNCLNKDCQVWTIKDGYRLGVDIQSKVLAFAFGLSAEIERNLISQRTKEALARIKSEGKGLGRPINQIVKPKLSGKNEKINLLLDNGVPKAHVAKRLRVSRATLYKWMNQDEITEELE